MIIIKPAFKLQVLNPRFIIFVFKVLFLYFLIVVPTFALTPSEQVALSNQVQQFLKVNTEIIEVEKVKSLSKK